MLTLTQLTQTGKCMFPDARCDIGPACWMCVICVGQVFTSGNTARALVSAAAASFLSAPDRQLRQRQQHQHQERQCGSVGPAHPGHMHIGVGTRPPRRIGCVFWL